MSNKAKSGNLPPPFQDGRQPELDGCPDNLTVAGYLDGMLDRAETLAFERHLEHCPHCRAAVEELRELMSALSGSPEDEISLGSLTEQAKKLVK
ncbi:hypothetical protein JCM15519_01930 [Fundidesulfovibrio butyratiphilus]